VPNSQWVIASHANHRSWDEQNALLVESHERVIAELAEDAEAKLAEEVLAAESLRQEKDTLQKEAEEVQIMTICNRARISVF
jgi:hypothetical protein